MKERDIEKYLVERVKGLGGEVRKVKWIGRRGAPDRLVMLPFRVCSLEMMKALNLAAPIQHLPATIWVELKAPGQKPEPHQAREHKRMRAMGQRVEVIDSVQAIEEMLR